MHGSDRFLRHHRHRRGVWTWILFIEMTDQVFWISGSLPLFYFMVTLDHNTIIWETDDKVSKNPKKS